MKLLKNLLEGYRNHQQFTALNKRRLPIGFYSEMGTDRIYFEGMIHRLVEQYKQPVLYLSSSPKDPMLTYQHPDFHPVMIGDGLLRNIAFRDLNVDVFVMTLPDLETFELKRSIYPVHYAYVFHSLVSTHMIYRDKAFDAYDTMFCVGPHHESEIREAEHIFGLKPKAFVQHGYPRIDKIIEDYRLFQKSEPGEPDGPSQVLIAPSWGENSITNQCLHPLVQRLLDAGFAVTFRPHPMTNRDEPERIEAVRKAFGQHPQFHLDLDIAQTETLFRAEVMISDWSGVALEFSLATEKPVLFIDVPRKLNNPNFERFDSIPVEISLREKLGAVVSPQAIEMVPELLSEMARTMDARKQSIAEIRSQLVYNIGRSSEVGAAEVMNILARLKSGTAQAPELTGSAVS